MGRTIADVRQLPLLVPETRWRPPEVLPSLKGCKRIALDTETCDPDLSELGPGTFRGTARIVGLSIATDDGRRAYLPVGHAGGGNCDEKVIRRWAVSELNAFDGEVVGARLVYDLEMLSMWGVTLPNVKRFHDIQVAEPLLDEHRLSYGLDALAQDYLGEHKVETKLREAAAAYGWETNRAIKQNLWRLPAAYVGEYAEGDVDQPLRIFERQWQKLTEQDLLRVYDVESRLIPVLVAMRLRGVRVNVRRAEEVRRRLNGEREKILAAARRIAGPQFELMAPDSFVRALEERGLRPPLTPKTGRPSITKGWLKQHESDELVGLIMAGRRVNTIITTFIDGHVLTHSVRGRIHCQFEQLKSDEGGTIGRFSSHDPNLQNVPARDEEIAPLIRGLFEPDEGEDWERHDMSQMEYRLQVHYAVGPGAEEARRMYNENPKTDFHKYCATMLGVDPDDKVKRKRVKNVNFAKSYGAQAPKIALTFGCSVEEAQEFIKEYERALPFTVKTFDRVDRYARQHGYIRTLLGRYARYQLWEPAANGSRRQADRKPAYSRERAEREYPGEALVRAGTYTALNRLLQLGNADCVKKAMAEIWESGVRSVLGAFLLQVHDELDYSVPRTTAGDEAARAAREMLETTIPLRVPVLVEAQRGANWGACA